MGSDAFSNCVQRFVNARGDHYVEVNLFITTKHTLIKRPTYFTQTSFQNVTRGALAFHAGRVTIAIRDAFVSLSSTVGWDT